MSESEIRLTAKQELFVEHFLGCWNATSAAKAAGYKNPRYPGWQLKQHPDVAERLRERIEEMRVEADEALVRTAQRARFNLLEYIDIDPETGHPSVNLAAIREAGLGHVVRQVRQDRHGRKMVEVHSAERADEALGKGLGLFREPQDTGCQEPLKEHDVQRDLEELARRGIFRLPGS